jgi:Putative zinc-finger
LSDDTSDLDAMLGFFAEEGRNRRDPGEHLSPEALTAYHAHELSPEEDERIQTHLAACQHCTEMLLELEAFLRPSEVRAETVADFEAEADWRRLRSRLRGAKSRLTYAMAAVLLMAVVGLSIYALLHSPERLHTLEPLNSFRGRTGAADVVELPVTLLLKSPAKTPYPEYRADLRNERGDLIKTLPHLRESRSFDLEVPLERGELGPGEYRIELLRITGRTADRVGEYAFQVRR